jgi:hypothetical protein
MTITTGPPSDDDGRLLVEWNLNRAGMKSTRLFETAPGRYLVRVGDHDSYEIHAEPAGIIVHPGSLDQASRESTILGTPAAVSMALHGRIPVHAGSVDVDGRAVVLAAAGSFGKTTLAGAFHAAGYRLLADDVSCATVGPAPAILPGPAVIRARPDVMSKFKFSRATAVHSLPTRTHLALDRDSRGSGDPVPLGAIVFLRISDGPLMLKPAPVSDAVRDLFGLSFWLPTDQGQARGFELAAQLAAAAPIWNLDRPLTVESLPEIIETIVETCLG